MISLLFQVLLAVGITLLVWWLWNDDDEPTALISSAATFTPPIQPTHDSRDRRAPQPPAA